MSSIGLLPGRKRASTIPPNPSVGAVGIAPVVERRNGEQDAIKGHNKDAIEVTWLSELSNSDRDRWKNMCKSQRSTTNTTSLETEQSSSSPDNHIQVKSRRRAVSLVDTYLQSTINPSFQSIFDNKMLSKSGFAETTNSADLYKKDEDSQTSSTNALPSYEPVTTYEQSEITTPQRKRKSNPTQTLLSPRQSLYSAPTTSVSKSADPFDISSPPQDIIEDTSDKITPEEDPIFQLDGIDKDASVRDQNSASNTGLEVSESETVIATSDYFSPSSPENLSSSPIDIKPNLKASEVSPPFLQRRFTAPEKSYMSLQERRLSLRNRHLNAVPLSKSSTRRPSKMSPSTETVNPSSEGATPVMNNYHPRHKKSFGDLSNVHETPVSNAENVRPQLGAPMHSLPNHLSNRRYSSLQDSLRHRKSPSMENSSYIEHLEGQVADLTTKLQSYTSPSSEKSHAAVVQRLNNKVRSLENQIAEWENVFDDRVRENERRHADTERIYVNKLKSLREQILMLDQNNVTLEEDLERERKENVSLRLEVTEKKALALENAKLADALKNTFNTIEKLEAEVAILNSPTQATVPQDDVTAAISHTNGTKDKTTSDQTTESTLRDIVEESTFVSPHSSVSDFASLGDVRHDFGEHIKTANHRHKRMRKFPSASQPKQLILTTPVESSPPSSSRRSSVDPFTTDLQRNSNRWSISKEEPITASESLFAELAKQDEDLSPTTDEDEDDKEPIIPKSLHDEHAHCPPSPTDTETTSDTSGSTFSDVSPSSPTSPSISNLFFAPFRVTSSVITHVSYGILHPQKAVRSARKKAISTFIENRYVDIPMDTKTYSQVDELKHGNTVSPVSYQDICQPTTHLLMNQNNDKKMDSVDRHQTVRQSMLKEFILKSGDESSSDESSSRERHLANTFSKLCAEDSEIETTPRPRRIMMSESPPSDAEATIRASSARREGLRLDTKMLNKRPTKIPIRPSARSSIPSDIFDPSSRRVSLPPPYSEHADRAQARLRRRIHPQQHQQIGRNKATRDSLDLAWSSGDEPDTETSLYIPESELARVLRQDISNGSLMHAMGLHLNSPFVLWTKLVLSFMITMFVAIRDGPEAALNHIDLGRKDD